MQKCAQKIVVPLIMISISSLITIAGGFYAIAYYILSTNRHWIPAMTGDPIVVFDPHIGFRASASARSQRAFAGGIYEIITDPSGARISSPDEKQPINTTAPITVVGPSFAWGHGLSNEQTFARILQNRLDTKVKNYAMGSYSGVASLKSEWEHAQGSGLIIFAFASDLITNISPCASAYGPFCIYAPTVRKDSKGAFFIEDEVPTNNLDVTRLYFNLVEGRKLTSLNNFWLGAKYVQNSVERLLGWQNQTMAQEYALDAGRFVVEQMAAYANKVGAKLLVVNVGVGQSNEEFSRLSNMNFGKNTYFLDASKFPDRRPEDLILKNDSHPSALAHELIADRILQEIEKKSLNTSLSTRDGSGLAGGPIR
jgi:hypothetical protein